MTCGEDVVRCEESAMELADICTNWLLQAGLRLLRGVSCYEGAQITNSIERTPC